MTERAHFFLKTEPDVYSWDTLIGQVTGRWDGVRNYAARNQLRAMRLGDLAFFYHTGSERRIVGIVEVVREHYPDPTAESGDFSAVDVKPLCALTRPVTLAEIKQRPELAAMVLVRSSRLSVQPVTKQEFELILQMGLTASIRP